MQQHSAQGNNDSKLTRAENTGMMHISIRERREREREREREIVRERERETETERGSSWVRKTLLSGLLSSLYDCFAEERENRGTQRRREACESSLMLTRHVL